VVFFFAKSFKIMQKGAPSDIVEPAIKKMISTDEVGEEWYGAGAVIAEPVQTVPAEDLSVFADDIFGKKHVSLYGRESG
jgi:hypothetical protein